MIFSTAFIVSCSKSKNEKDYFLIPHTLIVTFDDGEVSIKGTLETEPGKTVFRPDIPQGVTVSFDGASGSISYDGIVFGNSVIGFSRLMPLHTALADGSAKSVFGKASHPDTVTGEGFCLTVHKEITE